jgi:Flp pilus assembly pilin Flp
MIGSVFTRATRNEKRFAFGALSRHERGAAAVEFALIATLLVPIVLGIVDYGTLFQKRQSVQDASRAGARVGSATCAILSSTAISANCVQGNRKDQDARILDAVRARLGSSAGDVEKIVVYLSIKEEDVSGTMVQLNGRMVGACDQTTVPGGVPDYCNVYGPAEFDALSTKTPAEIAAAFSCDPINGLSHYWCPENRDRALSAEKYIGVEVQLKHEHVFSIFGSDEILRYRSVFRLDPNAIVPDRPKALPPPPPSTTTTIAAATTTTTAAPATTTTLDPSTTTTTLDPSTTSTVATPATTTTLDPATTTTVAAAATTTTLDPATTTTTTTSAGPTATSPVTPIPATTTTVNTPTTTTTIYTPPTTTTVFVPPSTTTTYVAPTTTAVYVAPPTTTTVYVAPPTTTTIRRPTTTAGRPPNL